MKNITSNVPTAIIYTRVSSREQLEGFSLESQEKSCRNFAEKNNLSVLALFREEGESAKTADRTQLQRLLKYAGKNRGKIGKLIIYKVDRLARKSLDYATIRFQLKTYGIDIVSATEAIEDTPQGKFMEVMLSGYAELDNDIRAQRTTEGMKTRLQNGLFSFGAPLGYKNSVDLPGNKIIEPDPEKAPLIKMIFEKYADGLYSFKDIAEMVNKSGLRTKHGKKLYPQRIARILKNHLYYGWIEVPRFDVSTQGKHEPIVSKELFFTVQKILNGEKTCGKKLPRNRDNPDFPLRGIQCSGCGHNLSGGWVKGKTKRYAFYGCIYSACPKKKSIRKKELEDSFEELLRALSIEDKEARILKQAIKLSYESEAQSIISSNKKIKIEIEKLELRKQSLLDLKLKGNDILSDEEFKAEKERIAAQIINLETSRQTSGIADLNLENAIDYAFALLKDLPEKWRGLEVAELRVLRSILFPKNLVFMYPGIKTPELACILKLKETCSIEKKQLVALRGIEPLF